MQDHMLSCEIWTNVSGYGWFSWLKMTLEINEWNFLGSSIFFYSFFYFSISIFFFYVLFYFVFFFFFSVYLFFKLIQQQLLQSAQTNDLVSVYTSKMIISKKKVVNAVIAFTNVYSKSGFIKWKKGDYYLFVFHDLSLGIYKLVSKSFFFFFFEIDQFLRFK